ncbi:MAG: M24 family metallopeptidase C-terminal domain-containing protein, partial [Bacteroidales bacterium]
RTIPLGPLTQEEKEDYTLILKGHIDLAKAVFPERTRGSQLDILARLPIWERRMNYLHGTGHGVGAFLNVHEGPQSIRMEENPVVFQAGMTVTDEPGLYKAGSHGIRTENVLLTIPAGEGMFGNYLKFETVTLCPIDKRPILKEMLTKEEIEWLNQYHLRVYDLLAPHLDFEERYWLAKATSAL